MMFPDYDETFDRTAVVFATSMKLPKLAAGASDDGTRDTVLDLIWRLEAGADFPPKSELPFWLRDLHGKLGLAYRGLAPDAEWKTKVDEYSLLSLTHKDVGAVLVNHSTKLLHAHAKATEGDCAVLFRFRALASYELASSLSYMLGRTVLCRIEPVQQSLPLQQGR